MAVPDMKLIAGLGNPGTRYERNRHNIGFQVADELAARHTLAFDKTKHKARLADGHISGDRVLLVKPLTFMNAVGEAIQPLIAFFKIDVADLIVIYDDLTSLQGSCGCDLLAARRPQRHEIIDPAPGQ